MIIIRNLISASCGESRVSLVLKFIFSYSDHNFCLMFLYILAQVHIHMQVNVYVLHTGVLFPGNIHFDKEILQVVTLAVINDSHCESFTNVGGC